MADKPQRSDHERACRFRLASEGAAAIVCEHGFDCCPKCDPCDCDRIRASSAAVPAPKP